MPSLQHAQSLQLRQQLRQHACSKWLCPERFTACTDTAGEGEKVQRGKQLVAGRSRCTPRPSPRPDVLTHSHFCRSNGGRSNPTQASSYKHCFWASAQRNACVKREGTKLEAPAEKRLFLHELYPPFTFKGTSSPCHK